ncbi:phytoene desaturase family protein [Desulforhopalus singaporensis]|uniref:Phytoene dehydrogenase-related protein n=1 Tax=Desulforhopalus singaporensis TaxID=91360 RepID=A0A1H0PW29_9BACT|nr:NAD(P)/FAD-dependent oxidoreductase [Desulforhopalus singaporensis]SDP09000.1 Phytoene dehydrogenase-related protein [Desulforhopalus singaporensis]
MKFPVLVIGGGLSGLAAAIRIARFSPAVLLLEKHSRLGGLNSYFYRRKKLYETGLHAITNYAEPENKKAPLNLLLRQLKIKRKALSFCQQNQSKIIFSNRQTLTFTNNFETFRQDVHEKFPGSIDSFTRLLNFLDEYDPFTIKPFRSTRLFLAEMLEDPLLTEMILCPLLYYGSGYEDDMDLSQFAIMFASVYQQGFFRPEGTIRDFLEMLTSQLESLGGQVRKQCGVARIVTEGKKALSVVLESGEEIECDQVISTIGYQETLGLLGNSPTNNDSPSGRLGFVESIFSRRTDDADKNRPTDTIIFYNNGGRLSYRSPDDYIDLNSGVICFPQNFNGIKPDGTMEIRTTHLADYDSWKDISRHPDKYLKQKQNCAITSLHTMKKLLGCAIDNIVVENTFTPVTIERYTSKIRGALYGAPTKIKSGDIGYNNLFLAGTDQGFLGIIGSMLSGVTIVNHHVLPKL